MHTHPIYQRPWPDGGDRLCSGYFPIFHRTSTELSILKAMRTTNASQILSYFPLQFRFGRVFKWITEGIRCYIRYIFVTIFQCNSNSFFLLKYIYRPHICAQFSPSLLRKQKWLEFASNASKLCQPRYFKQSLRIDSCQHNRPLSKIP